MPCCRALGRTRTLRVSLRGLCLLSSAWGTQQCSPPRPLLLGVDLGDLSSGDLTRHGAQPAGWAAKALHEEGVWSYQHRQEPTAFFLMF